MDIVNILLTLLALAFVGYIVYAIVTYIPMLEPYKQAFGVVSVIFLIVYLILVLAGRAELVHMPSHIG